MKCPHCNQEHSVDTKFCPQTGKRIVLNCSFSESINFDRYSPLINHIILQDELTSIPFNRYDGSEEVNILLKNAGTFNLQVVKVVKESCNYGLAESKYLVDSAPAYIRKNAPLKEALDLKVELEMCGAEVEIIPTMKFSSSTTEDFKHGDIVIDGILLGAPYPYEYSSGNISPMKEGYVVYVPIGDGFYALKPILVTDGKEFSEIFISESVLNEDFLFSSQDTVEWMQIDIDKLPLLREIGIKSSNEIGNNIELIEQLGYMRIRNFIKPKTNYQNMASFISCSPNSIGSFVSIVLFDNYMYIFNDVLAECVSYYGGQRYNVKK